MTVPAKERSRTHLLMLPGGHYELWNNAVLRSAGFPFAELDNCAAEATCAALTASTESVHQRAGSKTLQALFAADYEQIDEALLEAARSDAFQKALCWQNRAALSGPIRSLLAGRKKARRQRLRTVASYLQRYCAKNDTIGFFGPSAWMKLGSSSSAIELTVGEQLIRKGVATFEHWAIQAVADAISQSPILRPNLAPRLLPWASITTSGLRIATIGTIPLPESQLRFLAACDGTRSAQLLIERFAMEDNSGEQPWLALLERSIAMDVLSWKIEVPMVHQPERGLATILEQLAPSEVRDRAIEVVIELEELRDKVTAAQSAADLSEAMAALETAFRDVAEIEATRRAGSTYGARTILVQDCARDCSLLIGDEPIERLAAPLSLILRSASWFTREVADGYRRRLHELFLEHRSCNSKDDGTNNGTGDIELAVLQKALLAEEPEGRTDETAPAMRAAIAGLQQRWSKLLPIDETLDEQRFSSEQIADTFDDLFPGNGPGWNQAIYLSPDLMLAAPSVEAIERGQFEWILNEVHLMNSVAVESFLCHHDDNDDFALNMAADYGTSTVTLELDNASVRYVNPLRGPKDIRILYDERPATSGGPTAVPIAELFAREVNGELRVVNADGSIELDPLCAISDILCDAASRDFSILAKGKRCPRIYLDEVVISRRAWKFPLSDFEWTAVADPYQRFIRAHAWWSQSGLPRRAFAKASWELKPVYVDWNSPVLVDFFVRLAKAGAEAGTISFTEMLPDPDQLWLRDSAGQHFTSELRVVAVDRDDRNPIETELPAVPRPAVPVHNTVNQIRA